MQKKERLAYPPGAPRFWVYSAFTVKFPFSSRSTVRVEPGSTSPAMIRRAIRVSTRLPFTFARMLCCFVLFRLLRKDDGGRNHQAAQGHAPSEGLHPQQQGKQRAEEPLC